MLSATQQNISRTVDYIFSTHSNNRTFENVAQARQKSPENQDLPRELRPRRTSCTEDARADIYTQEDHFEEDNY